MKWTKYAIARRYAQLREAENVRLREILLLERIVQRYAEEDEPRTLEATQ